MNRSEIKEALALPRAPTHIADVRPTRPVEAQVSTAAGREHGNLFGEGGKEQWRLLEDLHKPEIRREVKKWFVNPRGLPDD